MDGQVDVSDVEDISQMTNMERNEKNYFDHIIRTKFQGKPEVYIEVMKCIHLYTVVFSRNFLYILGCSKS